MCVSESQSKHKNQKEATHSKTEQKYNHSQTTELRSKVTFPCCFTSQVVYLALYFKSQYAENLSVSSVLQPLTKHCLLKILNLSFLKVTPSHKITIFFIQNDSQGSAISTLLEPSVLTLNSMKYTFSLNTPFQRSNFVGG